MIGREIYVETMLKQWTGRNQRTKGFKVKNSLKIFLLLAGCLWLLYQLKHSYDKKNEYEQNSRNTLEKLQFQHGTPQLGRKGFQPRIKEPEELIQDVDEIMPEKIKVRGGRSDEMNGHDQDKVEDDDSEEVEDLIDEEDKERIEEIEEDDGDDMVKNIEDISSLKDKSIDESDNENGASMVMMRKTQSTSADFEGGLGSSEKIEMLKQHNTVTVEHIPLQTVVTKGKDGMPDFSESLLKMEMTELGAYNNLARRLMKDTDDLRETSANENGKASDRGNGKVILSRVSSPIVKGGKAIMSL